MKKILTLLLSLTICLGVTAQQNRGASKEKQSTFPSPIQLIKILEQAITQGGHIHTFFIDMGFRSFLKNELQIDTQDGTHSFSTTTYLDGANRLIHCVWDELGEPGILDVKIKLKLTFKNYSDFINAFVYNGFEPLLTSREERLFVMNPENFIFRKRWIHPIYNRNLYYIKVDGDFLVTKDMCTVNLCFYAPSAPF